jgi:hypothetical protein
LLIRRAILKKAYVKGEMKPRDRSNKSLQPTASQRATFSHD